MSNPVPPALDAPLHVGAVSLVVRDLDRVSAFYRDVVGLSEIGRDGATTLMGAGGNAFLRLVHEPGADLARPRSSGLFHTAFLLPSRADLGRWLAHVGANRFPLQGMSDHGVSEAVYLADPEGNGIEIYADRPKADWPFHDGTLSMVTQPLDVEDLLASGKDASFAGSPAGTLVGHVHLQVGSADDAESFYGRVLGLDPMQRMTGAVFLSSGGYHHHVAANTWNSRGALPRAPGTTGLAAFELLARDETSFEAAEALILASGRTAARDEDTIRLEDPAGVGVVLRRA